MGNLEQKKIMNSATPLSLPEAPPTAYASSDYSSHIFQSISEIQRTLGKLEQSITNLSAESKRCGEVVDTISHKVYAAEKIIIVVGIILGGLGSAAIYFLAEIWKTISPLIQIKLPH
jgi:hypothetical protein